MKTATKTLRKAHTRDSLQALGPVRRGRRRPVPDRQPAPGGGAAAGARRILGLSTDQIRDVVEDQFHAYQTSLSADRRKLLERFTHRRHGPQGGRGRQRRHPRLDGAAPRPRHRRPAVPAGQGSHPVGTGGPPAEIALQHPRPTGGRRATADASHPRHLPRLDQRRPRRPLLLLAPTPRHESLRGRRDHDPGRDDLLRPDVRLDPRPRPRPLR